MDAELYHYGIRGMRWGIRRYQNKDGTLTAAGKKRAAKLESKYEKVTGKKLNSTSETHSNSSVKKNISDMSDDELRTKTARLQAERNYLDLQKQISSLDPPQISKGRAFVNSLGKDVLKPVAIDAGKKLLGDYVKKQGAKALGLTSKEVDDGIGELKKEFTSLNYKKQINELNKYFDNEEKTKAKAEKTKAEADVEGSRASEPKVTKPKKDREPIDVDFREVSDNYDYNYDRGRNYVLRLRQKN